MDQRFAKITDKPPQPALGLVGIASASLETAMPVAEKQSALTIGQIKRRWPEGGWVEIRTSSSDHVYQFRSKLSDRSWL